jgi:hypothetical protein
MSKSALGTRVVVVPSTSASIDRSAAGDVPGLNFTINESGR